MLHTYFDKTYLLNLDCRPDRLEQSTRECNSIGLEFERFPAINGRENHIAFKYYPKDPEAPALSDFWNAGTVGIIRSVKKIIETAKAKNYKSILIIEDDIKFHSSINDVVTRNFKDIPESWEFIFFGLQHVKAPEILTSNIARVKFAWCNHCFAIKHTIYDTFIDFLNQELKPADQITNEFHLLNNSYCFYPNMAFQREGFSDHTQKTEGEKI